MAVSLRLNHQVFYPGNMLTGELVVATQSPVYGNVLGVHFRCELYQHWTTTSTHSTGSGKNRRSRTVTHHHRKTTMLQDLVYTIMPGPFELPFGHHAFPVSLQIDPNAVPSIEHDRCRVRYTVMAVAGHLLSPPAPIRVIVPMAAQLWMQPSARSEEREFDLHCQCCLMNCCARGSSIICVAMSKTAIALDRDEIAIEVHVDNTKSETDVENVNISLQCSGRVKVGHPTTFWSAAGQVNIPTVVREGQSATLRGVIKLNPFAPPSLRSSVVDIDYRLSGSLQLESGARMLEFNDYSLLVAHSVDMSGLAAQHMNFGMFVPMQAGASTAMTMMAAPSVGAAPAFAELPPPFFSGMPPLVFEQLPPDGDADE